MRTSERVDNAVRAMAELAAGDGSLMKAVAIAAVRSGSALTAHAQGPLLAGDTLAGRDDSPITVADFAASAIVCATLTESLGALDLVGEEQVIDAIGRILD